MRSVEDWDLSDLEALCSSHAEESTVLEFKRSPALENSKSNKEELCKDISAMANAAGGVVIYGIAENGSGEAQFVDEGCDITVKPEWIDQVLTSGVEPKLQGLTIKAISLPNGRKVFVVKVEQAITFAPHQVRSRKQYYKRTERRVEAMLDYEIRDAMRRHATPDLFLDLSVFNKDGKFLLSAIIRNRSSEPALYSLAILSIDAELQIDHIPYFDLERVEVFFSEGGLKRPARVFSKKMLVPTSLPIFKEAALVIIQELEIYPQTGVTYLIYYNLSCPGYWGGASGTLVRTGDNVVLTLEKLPQ